MIKIFKQKIIVLSIFNLKQIGVSICLSSGSILSSDVCAEDDSFVVSAKCKDEYNSSCDIVRTLNAKNEIVINDVKLLNISRINQNLYKVKTSCGSPCSVTLFYSQDKEDYTGEFIAIDSKNNCLIESNSNKKLIYARKIFSNHKVSILNLNDGDFKGLMSRFDYYTYFKHDSYFDSNGVLNLVAIDYSGKKISKKIDSPCGNIK